MNLSSVFIKMDGPEAMQKSKKSAASLEIVLPQQLDDLPVAVDFMRQRHSWNSNEEVAAILLSFDRHAEWQSDHVRIRPSSGSLLLYSRKHVRYRKDGYCWKKRKDGKTTREDHMKLKVRGVECIYGCYVHSSILPTFHRRCYWLLQNPNIVLVHYLNVPYSDDNKPFVPTLSHCTEKKEWTRQELIDQIRPMYTSAANTDKSSVTEQLTEEAVDSIVTQLMESQQKLKLSCDCGQVTGSHASTCRMMKCRTITPKSSGGGRNSSANVTGPPISSLVHSRLVPLLNQQSNAAVTSNVLLTTSTTSATTMTSPRPLILNLSQLQSSNGVIIVSGQGQPPISIIDSRKLQQHQQQQHQQQHLQQQQQQQHHQQHQQPNQQHQQLQHQKQPQLLEQQTLQEASNNLEQTNSLLKESSLLTEAATMVTSSSSSAGQDMEMVSSSPVPAVISESDLRTQVKTEMMKQYHDRHKMELQSSEPTVDVGHAGLDMVNHLNSVPRPNAADITNKAHPGIDDTAAGVAVTMSDSEKQHLVMEQQQNMKNEMQTLFSCAAYDNIELQKLLYANMVNANTPAASSSGMSQVPMNAPSTGNLSQHIAAAPTNNKPAESVAAPAAGLYGSVVDQSDVNLLQQSHDIAHHRSNGGGHLVSSSPSASLCSNLIVGGSTSSLLGGSTKADAKCHLIEHSLAANPPSSVVTPTPLTVNHDTHVNHHHSSFSTQPSSANPANLSDSLSSHAGLSDSLSRHAGLSDSLEHLRSSMVSPQSTDLNFDAFDILDLSDFDSEHFLSSDTSRLTRTGTVTMASSSPCLCVNSIQSTMTTTQADQSSHMTTTHADQRANVARTAVTTITDYSPDWSFPEGGVKVLVTGPWYSTSSSYNIVFDSVSVPGTLVQSGVLRCFCPAHLPGLVTMQVACEGVVVSNTCVFEYRSQDNQSAVDRQKVWFSIDDNALKLAVLEKLEEFEKRLAAGPDVLGLTSALQGPKSSNRCHDAFEDRLIEYCHQLRKRNWASGSDLIKHATLKGMTLLHLASALGYSRLISNIIEWRVESPCLLLEYEVDALSIDDNSSTPLLWACARGKEETAMVLYHWNPSALTVYNKDSLSPVAAAKTHHHHNIASMLERLDMLSASCVRNNPSLTGMTSWTPLDITIPPPPPYPGASRSAAKKTDELLPGSIESGVTMAMGRQRRQLTKRFSVEVLPGTMASQSVTASSAASGQMVVPCTTATTVISDGAQPGSSRNYGAKKERCLRLVNSDPHLMSMNTTLTCDNPALTSDNMALTCDKNPMISMSSRDLNSPNLFINSQSSDNSGVVAMETDSPCSDTYIEADDSTDELDSTQEARDQMQNQMATLANQIIEAMPERIKMSPSHVDELLMSAEDEARRERSSSHSSYSSATSPHAPADDSGISTPLTEGIGFEEYRYADLGTPTSSLSPASSCLQSPYTFNLDFPPPTTAEFNEYFNAPTTFLEKDFSQLTLSDTEQRKLYVAAKIIQNYFRQYKDKQQQILQQREREMQAAIIIQSYYRRYKQYEYYKKMTQAAVLIQSQFRSYYAKKRFKRSREAATVIQNQYRTYKEHERFKKSRNAAVIIQQRFRSHYQRKRNQEMSRKMQQLARQSSHSSETEQKEVEETAAPITESTGYQGQPEEAVNQNQVTQPLPVTAASQQTSTSEELHTGSESKVA